MDEYSTLDTLPAIISILLNLFLGVFVLVKNHKDALAKLFAAICFFSALFAIDGCGIMRSHSGSYFAGIWTRIFRPGFFFTPVVFYSFSLELTHHTSGRYKHIEKIFYASGSLLYLISMLIPIGDKSESILLPSAYLFAVIVLALAVTTIYKEFKQTKDSESKMAYSNVLLASVIGFGPPIYLNLFHNLYIHFGARMPDIRQEVFRNQYLGLIFYPLIILRTVVRYRFLEINIYSRRFSRLFTYFEHPSFLVMLYIAAIFFVYGRSPLKSSLYVIIGWIFISVMAALTNERVISTENARLQEQKREIGHSLKSPIELVRLIASRLKKSQAYSEDDIGRILQKTEELAESVRELLREKIKAEEKKPENLNHILETIAQRLSPQFEANNVNLTMRLEPELPPVSVVRQKMEEVFSNFIINAIEAMLPKGEGSLEISTAVKDVSPSHGLSPHPRPGCLNLLREERGERGRGEYAGVGILEIKISDTGIGISPDKLPKIFKRGYTDKAKGSGYGLYIAKKYINGLGGRIDVSSEFGKGTTFTVMLPFHAAE